MDINKELQDAIHESALFKLAFKKDLKTPLARRGYKLDLATHIEKKIIKPLQKDRYKIDELEIDKEVIVKMFKEYKIDEVFCVDVLAEAIHESNPIKVKGKPL